ncbi:MAG: cell division protein ZapB [Nitrospirota bacterium]
MALEKMEALEARVRGLVEMVQELKRTNAALQGELRTARERLSKQQELSHRWGEERSDIRSRIEKVLGELDFLESIEESKEVALG